MYYIICNIIYIILYQKCFLFCIKFKITKTIKTFGFVHLFARICIKCSCTGNFQADKTIVFHVSQFIICYKTAMKQ